MKKKIIFYFSFFTLIGIFTSCNSSDDAPQMQADDGIEEVFPTLQTNEATNIGQNTARLGGNLIDEGTFSVIERGVAWSLNTNPTVSDNSQLADGSGLGNYFVDILGGLQENTTYNFRAFIVTADGETVYGNNASFTTLDSMDPPPSPAFEFLSIRKITTSKMTVTAIVNETTSSVSGKGFVLADFPNPTINDIVAEDGDSGEGQYVVAVEGLEPNTLYYIRPYAYIQGQVEYGDEMTIKTVGYTGPAGGYVVYDKGEVTDGWQYMEASSQPMVERAWGCNGTFISGTAQGLGAGQQNTNAIVAGCGQSSIAAKYCDAFQLGGQTDWFLGSVGDMSIAVISMQENNTLLDKNSIWTSSQFDSTIAYWVSPGSDGEIFVDIFDKPFTFLVLPIRTY